MSAPLLPSLLLLLAAPAQAVIIDAADGSANTTAPPDDPGFAHVGRRGSLTAVYIGKSWVLTADHVGIGPVTLDGVSYDYVRDSKVTLQAVGAATDPPDLAVFRIYPEPPLPDLPIREDPPVIGLPVTMIGNGFSRGPATTWLPPTGPAIDGYEWASPHTVRWGTNAVYEVGIDVSIDFRETRSISTDFTESGDDECQAANGDSGGALFIDDGGTWELAGILFGVATYIIEGVPQPSSTALYENLTYSSDLSVYRDQILAIRDAPQIPSMPVWSLAALAVGLAVAGVRALGRSPLPSDS